MFSNGGTLVARTAGANTDVDVDNAEGVAGVWVGVTGKPRLAPVPARG